MLKQGLSVLFLLALVASLAPAEANDGNPCRHIEVFDPWLNGPAVFDLSPLIDHGTFTVNQTWNGQDFFIYQFGVCKPLDTACPNTEEGGVSVCGQPGKAALCQRYEDVRTGPGSFCVSAWNGTVIPTLDGDGERGIHILFGAGDKHLEFREATHMLMNIECDPTMDRIPTADDLYVTPPHIDSSYYTVSLRHKSGCPANIHHPAPHVEAPTVTPTTEPKKSGLPGAIVGLISVAMLLIGLFGGAFGGLWLNSKFGWFADPHRQAMAYSQFELDEDI